MKKLLLIFIALFLFSCNDDDYIKPIDYSQNISFTNSNLKHYSYDVLVFNSNVKNTSDKNIVFDVSFDIYYIDRYFNSVTLTDFEVSKSSKIKIQKTFDFRYFDYQHFNIRNFKFRIKKAY